MAAARAPLAADSVAASHSQPAFYHFTPGARCSNRRACARLPGVSGASADRAAVERWRSPTRRLCRHAAFLKIILDKATSSASHFRSLKKRSVGRGVPLQLLTALAARGIAEISLRDGRFGAIAYETVARAGSSSTKRIVEIVRPGTAPGFIRAMSARSW